MSHAERAFITLLLLFAAALRLIGASYGQPVPQYAPTDTARRMIHENAVVHPDEFLYVSLPLRMLVSGQLNAKFFENPSFLINLNFFTDLLSGAGGGHDYATWQGISERRHASFDLYVVGRVYSALGGVIAVAAAYAAARRLGGRYAAIGAGLITAVAFPLVQHGHYTTTSSLAAGFASVAVWAAVEALHRRHRSPWHIGMWLILSAFAAGLAAGNRYNAAAVAIVPGLLGLILLFRAWRTPRRTKIALGVVLGWLAIPLTFILTTPHVLFDPQEVWADFLYIVRQYGAGESVFTTPYGLVYESRYLVLYAIGIPASVLALIGLLTAFMRRTRSRDGGRTALVIILIYLVAYALFVLRTQRPNHSDQLLVPILPALALFVGMGASFAIRRLTTPVLRAGLFALISALPLALSLQLLTRLQMTDTRYVMQAWIETNIPHGAHVHLAGPYNVPLDEAHYTWTQNYGGQYPTLDEILAQGADYVLVSDAWSFDLHRSIGIVSDAALAQLDTYDSSLRQPLVEIARIDRPRWIGQESVLHTASVWYDPGLTLYCVPGRAC